MASAITTVCAVPQLGAKLPVTVTVPLAISYSAAAAIDPPISVRGVKPELAVKIPHPFVPKLPSTSSFEPESVMVTAGLFVAAS